MNPEIVVIDCGQNPLKGLNLLKEIKTKRPDIPVIFVTEESSEEIVIKAYKAGAREFFKKPLDVN
jgi:DNA-binding NtrC family response regulator